MTYWQALVLGVVQGFTEFLPVSSSGHLVIAQQLFGFSHSGKNLLLWDTLLHVGTLISVMAVFYRQIWQSFMGGLDWLRQPWRNPFKISERSALCAALIVGTIPAGLVGLFLKDLLEPLFASARFAAFCLLFTGIILFLSQFIKRSALKSWSLGSSWGIGCAQALAILPGVSRSGMTLVAGLAAGHSQKNAANFAFLLSVPAILGAMVLGVKDIGASQLFAWGPMLCGGLSATLSGYLAIHWMLRIIRRQKLHHFAYYCWLIGGIGLLFL